MEMKNIFFILFCNEFGHPFHRIQNAEFKDISNFKQNIPKAVYLLQDSEVLLKVLVFNDHEFMLHNNFSLSVSGQ